MFRFVKQLQKKPHHVRKQAALGTSAAVTLLIAVVWVSVSDFTPTASSGMVVVETKSADQAASPFRALGDDFSRITQGFRTLVGQGEEEEGIEVVEDSEPEVHSDIESGISEVDYSFE